MRTVVVGSPYRPDGRILLQLHSFGLNRNHQKDRSVVFDRRWNAVAVGSDIVAVDDESCGAAVADQRSQPIDGGVGLEMTDARHRTVAAAAVVVADWLMMV